VAPQLPYLGPEEGKMKKGLLILAASLMTLAPVSASGRGSRRS
jgi:hypothetical protein